jgi:antitoxin (DNA-binding transcriptional repressor) of toxin-antitoxin stability system
VVVVLRRGKPVAELVPARVDICTPTLPNREQLLSRFPRVRGDSGRFLEEDRS